MDFRYLCLCFGKDDRVKHRKASNQMSEIIQFRTEYLTTCPNCKIFIYELIYRYEPIIKPQP